MYILCYCYCDPFHYLKYQAYCSCAEGQKLVGQACFDADYSTEIFDPESPKYSYWITAQYDMKHSRSVDIMFDVKDVKEINLDTQKITLDIQMIARWQDSRISCAKCGSDKERVF